MIFYFNVHKRLYFNAHNDLFNNWQLDVLGLLQDSHSGYNSTLTSPPLPLKRVRNFKGGVQPPFFCGTDIGVTKINLLITNHYITQISQSSDISIFYPTV